MSYGKEEDPIHAEKTSQPEEIVADYGLAGHNGIPDDIDDGEVARECDWIIIVLAYGLEATWPGHLVDRRKSGQSCPPTGVHLGNVGSIYRYRP